MNYVKVGDSVHWYTEAGEPRHDATLREARKENLLPSVTMITKTMAAPGLDAWKQEQILLSSLTLPRVPGETDEEFARRVVLDSQEQAKHAARLGTMVHGWIARYLRGLPTFWGAYRPILEPVKEWIDLNIKRPLAIESVVVGDGYAGTEDLVCEFHDDSLVRIDWKTQGVSDPGIGKRGPLKVKINHYDTWPMQLAAYERADGNLIRNMNVVISSNLAYRGVWPKEWTQEEIERGWEMFDACHRLYRGVKKFEREVCDYERTCNKSA